MSVLKAHTLLRGLPTQRRVSPINSIYTKTATLFNTARCETSFQFACFIAKTLSAKFPFRHEKDILPVLILIKGFLPLNSAQLKLSGLPGTILGKLSCSCSNGFNCFPGYQALCSGHCQFDMHAKCTPLGYHNYFHWKSSRSKNAKVSICIAKWLRGGTQKHSFQRYIHMYIA